MGEFTKADLKDGMVVELRDGRRLLKLGRCFRGLNDWEHLDSYYDDLIDCECNDYDVMKVFNSSDTESHLDFLLRCINLELIWERKEVKRMTAEKMREKLEKLTGEKIEIESSRNEMVGVCYEHCNKYSECYNCCLDSLAHSCDFEEYSIEKLRECYKKVIADGQTEN